MGNIIVPCSGYSPEAKMFLDSAKAGDQGRIMALLAQNPELLTCRKGLSEQTTPWHMLAARSDALATLKTLVGFALSERSPFGDLPLAQRQEKLRALLDSENVRGQTVMLVACNQGHGEVVAYLVQQGADPFHGDRAGSTGLHLAARHGQPDIIRAILENVPESQRMRNHYRVQDKPSLTGLAPLHVAVASNQLACVEALLENHVYIMPRSKTFSNDMGFPITTGSTPLHVAALRGHMDIARAILRHHASRQSANPTSAPDPRWVRDGEGLTPYQVACNRNQAEDLVEILHPFTDLHSTFGLQALVTPAAGVAKLSVLAAAALQLKLMGDVRRVASAALLLAPAGSSGALPSSVCSPSTSYVVHAKQTAAAAAAAPRRPASGPTTYARDSARDLRAGPSAAATAVPLHSDAKGQSQSQSQVQLEEGGRPQLSGGSDELEAGTLCALCFERAPDVGIAGCAHRLCARCAEKLVSRVADKPLACPFCRISVSAFVGIDEE